MAACVWGVVPILEKLGLSNISPLTGLFYRCFGVLLGIVVLGFFVLKPSELKAVDTKTVLIMILSGFLASFVAQIFFYNGLKTGDVSKIVPIAGSFPMISVLLGVLLPGETITPSKFLGISLVISGICFLR